MKRLLVIVLILQVTILLVLGLLMFKKVNVLHGCDETIIETDTVINKVRIDSIHFLIIKQDSIINRIKIRENEEIKKAINSNDSDAVKLFKELVSN